MDPKAGQSAVKKVVENTEDMGVSRYEKDPIFLAVVSGVVAFNGLTQFKANTNTIRAKIELMKEVTDLIRREIA